MNWQDGFPLRSGIYNASSEQDATARRYFYVERKQWSAPWYTGDSPEVIARAAKTVAEAPAGSIRWRILPKGTDPTDEIELVCSTVFNEFLRDFRAAPREESLPIYEAGTVKLAVDAFNCLTGLKLTEKQGELFRFLLAYVEDDKPRAG